MTKADTSKGCALDEFEPLEFEIMSDKAAQGIGLAFGVAVAELLHGLLLRVNSGTLTDAEYSIFAALKTDLRVHIEELKS